MGKKISREYRCGCKTRRGRYICIVEMSCDAAWEGGGCVMEKVSLRARRAD